MSDMFPSTSLWELSPRWLSEVEAKSTIGAITAKPFASFKAVSNDSAKRNCMSSRTLKRSITTSIVCFLRNSNSGTASKS